ncbi:Kinase-like protein [Pleurostoma richardsiae]|uniref:Kinase-like protein n=1 Tax=Pleurostoma richardsiae TaxID=41990 RepID=A0AA38S1F4_9PEZI|nr:Kinase-like protein [Pleurostoma richardsiae]
MGRQGEIEHGYVEEAVEVADDGDDGEARLADRILKSFVPGVFDSKPQNFVPEGCIKDLVTEGSVIIELRYLNSVWEVDNALVEYILRKAPKVFAIAVQTGLFGLELCMAMDKFRKCDFGDSGLPIRERAAPSDATIGKLKLSAFMPKTLWTDLRLYNFYDHQWTYLSPVFAKGDREMILHPHHILPIIEVDHCTTQHGTFSDVRQVIIHDQHLKGFSSHGAKMHFAIKEIKDTVSNDTRAQQKLDAAWQGEVQALIASTALGNPNIIQLIAAVTQGQRRYLLFQWADGNLRTFWESSPQRPALNAHFIQEIVQQLRGLAYALYELHKQRFRHGDLKPENILRFNGPNPSSRVGTLKISDLGLAKHHAIVTGLRHCPTSTRFGTARYEPPEAARDRLDGESRSRLYDIWSMGVIALELVVWILHGYDQLKMFNDGIKKDYMSMHDSDHEAPPYYEIESSPGKRIAKVHPVVASVIQQLEADPECSRDSAIRDLVDIVKNNLLVVKLQPWRLSRHSTLRPPVDETGDRQEAPTDDERMEDEDAFEDPEDPEDPEEPSNNIVVTQHDAEGSEQAAHSSSNEPCRATAEKFYQALDVIIGKGNNNPSYWFTGISRDRIQDLKVEPRAAEEPKQFLPLPLLNQPAQKIGDSPIAVPPELAQRLAPAQAQSAV